MTQKKDDTLKIDARLIEKNLRKGYLSQKELDKHLKSLPDISEKSEKLFKDDDSESDSASRPKQ